MSAPLQLQGARATAYTIYRGLGWIFAAAVVVQFALAGTGVFGAKRALDEASSLDAHRMLGNVLALVAALMLVAVLVARPARRPVWASVLLLIATGATGALAQEGVHAAWVGGLHVIVGVIILGLATWTIVHTATGGKAVG